MFDCNVCLLAIDYYYRFSFSTTGWRIEDLGGGCDYENTTLLLCCYHLYCFSFWYGLDFVLVKAIFCIPIWFVIGMHEHGNWYSFATVMEYFFCSFGAVFRVVFFLSFLVFMLYWTQLLCCGAAVLFWQAV